MRRNAGMQQICLHRCGNASTFVWTSLMYSCCADQLAEAKSAREAAKPPQTSSLSLALTGSQSATFSESGTAVFSGAAAFSGSATFSETAALSGAVSLSAAAALSEAVAFSGAAAFSGPAAFSGVAAFDATLARRPSSSFVARTPSSGDTRPASSPERSTRIAPSTIAVQ